MATFVAIAVLQAVGPGIVPLGQVVAYDMAPCVDRNMDAEAIYAALAPPALVINVAEAMSLSDSPQVVVPLVLRNCHERTCSLLHAQLYLMGDS